MKEVTERMRELGLTPELLKKWQQEEEDIPEPSWYVTPRDQQLLEQRKADGEAAHQNGHGNKTVPVSTPGTPLRKAEMK